MHFTKRKLLIWLFNLILLIIMMIILYNIFSLQNTKRSEGFTKNKKGLLVLFGESFREGNQNTRLRDTKNSIEPQKSASKSHVDFCNYIKENYDIQMDIVINTYDTKYENELKGWYGNYLLKYMSNPELIGPKIAQDAIDNVANIQDYDFVFITRVDIYIKPHYYKIFNPEWDKIYFISQCWTITGCGFLENSDINYPRVNPTFEYFPKKYFRVLKNIDVVSHESWKHYIDTFQLTTNDLDFMVDYYHDSDSYKDFNPYYKMAGRKENNVWHDRGKKIDRSIFGTKTPITCKPLKPNNMD